MQTSWNTAALISLIYFSLSADLGDAVSSGRVERFKCFICHWIENDHKCGDEHFQLEKEESGRYMINCTACYKKVKRSSSGEKNLILRGCDMEIPHYDLKCQYFYYSDRSFEETCTCTGEYCNGDDIAAKSLHILVISLAILTAIFGASFELALF